MNDIYRKLTLRGWNHYQRYGYFYSLISKSEYLKLKQENKIKKLEQREYEDKLRKE